MAEIELTDVPADLVEAMQVEDASRSRTLHTHTAPGGTMRNREGIAHSYGVGVTGRKEGVREFLEQIDRGIHKHLADQEAPLVLAGVDYLLAMFREVTSYRHVLGEGIAGNPQGLSEKQLHDRAWVLVEPHFQRERERVLGLLGQVAGTGQCGLPLEEVVKAAFQGRIQYLLVVPEAERWGTIDPAALNVEVHERRQPGDEDLVNLALAHALRHKTKAFAVEANQLPEGAAVAAVYWLPIGERRDKRVLASGP